jgi:hypothetical protein
MAQAARAQQHEKTKGGKISKSVPVHGYGPELQRNRVDGGVNKHGGYCALG